MPVYVFIPARLSSTRLPGKVLKNICGKPLVQWVFEGCSKSKKADKIYIATDSHEVKEVAKSFGAEVIITSSHHKSGTDRIAEACSIVGCSEDDIIVNVQGDEPMVEGILIDLLVDAFSEFSYFDVLTLVYPSSDTGEFMNPNVVKVVIDNNWRALYFSRSPIPYFANTNDKKTFWKHMGYYCYTYKFLKTFVSLPQGNLEQIERLEQLRILENGFSIGVKEAPFETIGVDTGRDIEIVSKILRNKA